MNTLFECSEIKNGIKLELIGNENVWYLIIKTAKNDSFESHFKFNDFGDAVEFAREKYQVASWRCRDGVSFQKKSIA